MSDPYAYHASGLTAPATGAAVIVPSDSGELPTVPRALWIGGDGDLTVTMRDGGDPVTFTAISGGTLMPLRVLRVHDTGTTVTDIVGVW